MEQHRYRQKELRDRLVDQPSAREALNSSRQRDKRCGKRRSARQLRRIETLSEKSHSKAVDRRCREKKYGTYALEDQAGANPQAAQTDGLGKTYETNHLRADQKHDSDMKGCVDS